MQEEEFLFKSTKWKRQENDRIKVEQIDCNQYIVNINTREKVAELKFINRI